MKPDSTLVLPAENRGWEIWQCTRRSARLRRRVDMLDELPNSGAGTVIGVPAQECTSFVIQVPTADQNLFASMVYAQLEKRGMANGSPEETAFAWHVVERTPTASTISVDVLPGDFNEDYCVNRAGGYAAAARFFPIPDHQVVVTREHDRLLLIAGMHGRMIFSQILNCGVEFGIPFIQEVNLAILALQGAGQLPERVGMQIWADVRKEEKAQLAERLNLPVEFRKRPDPDSGLIHSSTPVDPMLPLPVRDAVQRRLRRARVRMGVIAVLGLYLVLATVATGWFLITKQKAEQLRVQVERDRPEVQEIQQAFERKLALQPAWEKDLFPMVQLNEIVRLMPTSGLVIREFETKGQNVQIQGVARDAQLAFGFMEDLGKETTSFYQHGYEWSMPQPEVEDNNTATFRITGAYVTQP